VAVSDARSCKRRLYIATVPAVAAGLPPEIASLTPMQYRKPEELPEAA